MLIVFLASSTSVSRNLRESSRRLSASEQVDSQTVLRMVGEIFSRSMTINRKQLDR